MEEDDLLRGMFSFLNLSFKSSILIAAAKSTSSGTEVTPNDVIIAGTDSITYRSASNP